MFGCMERQVLEGYLARGLSLEQIGALVSRDPSTVGYWLRKHGLRAVHGERHASRGGPRRESLEGLVQEGLSTRQIADRLERSPGTVRHWLRTYGLRTAHEPRRQAASGIRGADPARRKMSCARHGETDFWLEGRGIYRCLKCRSEAVSRRRRRVKEILVQEAGGHCTLCGYGRWIGALHFHHRDSQSKAFGLSDRGWTRSLAAARAEAEKCVLLCSNCHAEVEAGMVSLE